MVSDADYTKPDAIERIATRLARKAAPVPGMMPGGDRINATISSIRHDPQYPGDVKELAIDCLNKLNGLPGLIAGSIEVAYRRGVQAGEEATEQSTPKGGEG